MNSIFFIFAVVSAKTFSMDVIFLGTGSSLGTPVIGCNCEVCKSSDLRDKRLRSSVFINIYNKNIIIDAGPDFRQQLLMHNIDRVDAILLTHPHRDHIAGLDDIRSLNYWQKRPMPIYANKYTLRGVKRMFGYSFEKKKYPGVPVFDLHIIEKEIFNVQGVDFVAIEARHAKMPVLGFRTGDFTYLTDISFIEEKEIDKVRGTDVLVINALRKEPHLSHFNLSQALDFIEEIKPRKAYLTHISHSLGLYADIAKILPDNVTQAFDGLRISV